MENMIMLLCIGTFMKVPYSAILHGKHMYLIFMYIMHMYICISNSAILHAELKKKHISGMQSQTDPLMSEYGRMNVKYCYFINTKTGDIKKKLSFSKSRIFRWKLV